MHDGSCNTNTPTITRKHIVMMPRKRRQLLKIRVKISCFYIDLWRTKIKKKKKGEEGKEGVWRGISYSQ